MIDLLLYCRLSGNVAFNFFGSHPHPGKGKAIIYPFSNSGGNIKRVQYRLRRDRQSGRLGHYWLECFELHLKIFTPNRDSTEILILT